MNQDYYSNSNDYINRWVISYADFITMLLALFMVLYAVSSMGQSKIKDVNKSLEKTFSAKTVQTQVKETKTDEIKTEQYMEQQQIAEKLKNSSGLDSSVKILTEKRGVVIRLNDAMIFDQGSAIIKPEAKIVLDKIAVSLDSFKNPVVIEGHTDSVPIKNDKYPSNWELSTARATNIIAYLTQIQKFAPGRLSAVGYGEYSPIADNNDPLGRAKNRRVDIIIMSSK